MEHKIDKFLIQTNSSIFLSGLVTLSWYLEEVNGSWSRVCQLKPRAFFVFVAENSKFLITKESKAESRVPSKIFKVEPPSGNMQTSSLLLFLICCCWNRRIHRVGGGEVRKNWKVPKRTTSKRTKWQLHGVLQPWMAHWEWFCHRVSAEKLVYTLTNWINTNICCSLLQ